MNIGVLPPDFKRHVRHLRDFSKDRQKQSDRADLPGQGAVWD